METPAITPKPMTRKEIADHFTVSVRTVDGWKANGCPFMQDPTVKNGVVRFNPDAVSAWLTSQEECES